MRGITRTLGVCSAVFLLAASAHAEVMYFNPLAGNTSVPADTYGSITVSYALRATAFGAEQSIFDTGRYGTPAGMLAKSGDNKFINRHTVMGWFRVDAETLPTNQLLWYTGNEAGKDLQGYSVKVTSDGKLSFQRCRTGTGADASAPQTLATTAGNLIAPQTWFHVALVVDATNATRESATVKLYLNGEEVANDTRDVRLNGANVCTKLQVAQGVSASTFYVDTAVLDAAAIQARAANTFVRTLGSTGNWTIASDATDWNPGVAGASPTSGYVMVMVPQDSTLTMDASPSLTHLLIAGTNAGTNALTLAANSGSLTSETTKVETNTDVSAITASLGAVTIASGKELTVNNFSQYNSLAAGSTIGVNVKTTEPLEMAADNVTNISKLVVRSGTVKSLISGQHALAHNRAIEVTGASANLVINEKDGTGWEAANGSIAVRDGATLTYNVRDTLRTPVALCQGTVALASGVAGDDGRAMDLYLGGGNNWTVEAKEGATVDAPTESSLKALGTGTNRKILIRNGDWNINVAEKAQMTVDADLDTTSIATNTANGDRGALVKTGAGVLILKGNNSAYNKNTQINGGTVKLTNGATLGTGTATVASGATLEVVTVAETPRAVLANTLTNNGNYVISGNGVATLGSARTLPVTSIVSPAKVRVTKQDGEERAIQIATQLTEATWTNDDMPFEVVDSDGNSVTTYGGKVTADGVVQIELIDSSSFPTVTLSAETTNTLSGLSWNPSLINTKGAVINTGTGTDAVTLELDTALTTVPTSILITGTAPLTITGSATLANVVIDAGTAVTVATPSAFGSAVEVNGTLIVDCATALVESETVISGFGKLIKRGSSDLVLTATANHTFAGGTDIEEGKIGLSSGALGTGPIALKGTEDAPAGLWLWANAAVTVANDVELSGSAEFYIPLNRTLTLSGTVSGTGAAKVTTASGRGELRFSNVAVSKCTYTGTWTIPASTTLRFGDASAGGSNALTANSTCSVGSEVIVEERGTLIVNPWTDTTGDRDKDDTGKVTLTTKVTLNGGTLTMPDGSYAYAALNVTAASTVSATHPKGIVFKTFYGSGDLTVKALSSAYGSPLFAFWWPNVAGNGNSVEYTGKMTFTSECTHNTVMQVVPDTGDAFKKAYLHFEGNNAIEFLLGGDRTVGALDGHARLTIKSLNANNRTLTIGTDYTGTAANDSFAGTIADSVNLTLAANVEQTITGTLGTVTNGVASYARVVTLNTGSTLKLSPSAETTLSAGLSGSGALKVLSGTVTLSGANGNYLGVITVANQAVLTNNGSSASVPFGKGSIVNDGTVKLMGTADGDGGGQLPPTSGSGDIVFCAGSTSRISGEITTTGTVTFEEKKTSPTATNAAAVTFVKNNDFSEKVASIKGASVVVGEGVSLAKNEAASPRITIANGKTLSGTGTINLPLTFESGATLDASAEEPLTAQTVTIADGATVSVTLPSTPTAGKTILNCTNPAEVVGKLTTTPTTPMPTGLKFAATETAVVLANVGNYKVGDQAFETLQAALTSITTGETKTGTITVDASAPAEIPLTKQILVDDVDADITLDLGGKTLSAAEDSLTLATATGNTTASGVIWLRQGSLTVKNGTITTDGRAIRVGVFFNPQVANPVIVGAETAVLTLESNLSVTSTGDYTVTPFQGAKVTTAADITASGAKYYALSGNGNASAAGNNNTTIEITGGTISNATGVAIYHPQGGTLTISGGSISGMTALYARAGTITITGGTFTGYGPVADYDATANGAPALGDAVVIDNHSGYQALTASITGGNFAAQYGAPIASYSNGNEAYPVLKGFVSGGCFNTAIAGSLCKEGKCCVKNTDRETAIAYPWTIGTLPAIAGGEGSDETIDTPEAKDVIGEIIANATTAPTSVEVVAGKKSGADLPPAEVADALAIFGSSVTTTATTDTGKLTITVSYDFGISEVYQDGNNIVVKAKVQKSNKAEATISNENAATISNGVTLTLVDGDGVPLEGGVKTLNAATQEVAFSIPVEKIAGKTFKVKATK